jgi:dipeptidyl aminopeptidase/acylaminoacyl peptidase
MNMRGGNHLALRRFLAVAAVLAAQGAATPAARADLPPLIPRETLFGNPEKTQPRISPDGKLLAYLAPQEGVLNVWVRTVGQADDQVVTADKKRGIRFFAWQQDSENLLYIQDQGGDENFHVYQTNLKAKSTRDLTPYPGARAQNLMTDPRFPGELLVGLNLRDKRLHDVHRIDLKTGGVELDTQNPGDVAAWVTDNRFQVRIAQAMRPDGGMVIRIRDDAKSPWRTLTEWGPDETFGGVIGFTPDDKGVWLVTSVGANAARLVELDVASGKTAVLAEDPQYDISGVLVHPKKRTLEAVQFHRARQEWTVLDKTLLPDFGALRQVRDGDFYLASRDLEDKTWIVAYVVDDGPVAYYAYDRATQKATPLMVDRPALAKYPLAKMQPISFAARDGLQIHGYLSLPPGLPPKSLPMVLNVHGGPWGRDQWGLRGDVQWLANRGYAVLLVNFRGSTGYGKAHLNAGNREWGAKMHDDLLDAKKWAIAEGYADPKKVCIFGGSYGGYAVLVGLAFTPEEFACGVDIVGPSNLVTLLKSIPPYWIPMKSAFDRRVGKVETEEDFLKSRSPLFKAGEIKAPLLIGQGANDPRVKQAESDQIVEAMRKNGKPVEYLVFPDEGHGFARPENRLKFFAATEAFLAKYLGGRAEPPGDKEKVDDLRK